MLSSVAARSAVYDSDTAWNAVVASTTAKAALLSSSSEHIINSTTHTYPTGSSAGVRAVLVQQKSSSDQYPCYAGASTDTYSTRSTNFIDRYVRVTGLTHRIHSINHYSYLNYIIMQ